MSGALRDALVLFLLAALPLLVINFFIAGLGSIALSGWVFSAKQLEFKGSRIDPMAGLQRMFSSKSLVELAKSILKVLVIGGVALFSVSFILPLLIDVARMELNPLSRWSIWWSFSAALAVACSTLLIALVDVPVQIVQFTQKMRMTRQEVKDEMKDSDGKPEVKARQRELQRQLSSQEMLTDVPKADVVIVNPEHYAVALRYDPQQASAPVVVAKGVDYLAFRIRGIAQEHDVPVLRSPALARSVYHHTPIGAQIPDGLFLAVAEVLAYVHQMRVFQRGGGVRPVMPANPSIPPELDDDEPR